MAPTTEQLILMKLTGIEERQIEQGEAIAEIKGKMSREEKYCVDCKNDIYHNIDVVYERVRQVEIDRAKNAGIKEGKQEAENDDDKKLSRWTMIIGFAFSVGASFASFLPNIKQWLTGATK